MTTLAKARALIEAHGKATPGPWTPGWNVRYFDKPIFEGYRTSMCGRGPDTPVLPSNHPRYKELVCDPAIRDGEFIATARNDSPAIAEALVEVVALLQRLTALPPEGAALDLKAFMAAYMAAKDDARAFLAKHSETT